MFQNFSSLDHRSIFLVYYYRPYFRKKKKKKKKKKKHFFRPPFQRFAPDRHRKQNKTKQKQNPLKDQLFTSLHTLVHFWILLSARGGTLGKLVIGKDWHMNKNLKSQNYQQFYFGIMYASCS